MARAFVSARARAAARRLDHVLSETISDLQAGVPVRPLAPATGGSMSKLREAADRVASVRAAHARRADAAAAKANELAARGDTALDMLESELSKQEADIVALESETRQMSNGG
jgi:hypothetical protein